MDTAQLSHQLAIGATADVAMRAIEKLGDPPSRWRHPIRYARWWRHYELLLGLYFAAGDYAREQAEAAKT